MRTLLHSVLFLLGCTLLHACLPTPGCMDLTAENYNVEAEENDGSCIASRPKLIGNYSYTNLWNNVFTTTDTITFGTLRITEAGTANNEFYVTLDGVRVLKGSISAFDLVIQPYSETEFYEGFSHTRGFNGTGEWLLQDTVQLFLTLNTQAMRVEGNPVALTILPQTYNYYLTKVN